MAASRFLLAPTSSSFGSGLVRPDLECENMGYNVCSNQGQPKKPVFATNNGFWIWTRLSGSEKITKFRPLWFKNHSWLQSLCWLFLAVFRIRTRQSGFVINKYSRCESLTTNDLKCQRLCLKYGQALLSNLTLWGTIGLVHPGSWLLDKGRCDSKKNQSWPLSLGQLRLTVLGSGLICMGL